MRVMTEQCAPSMRTNDIRYRLDDLLAEWHKWCRGFSIVGQHGTAPMFNGLVSSKQWDSEHEVLDDRLHSSQLEIVEFSINGDEKGQGAMPEPYRTAISFKAKNLATGKNVWISPRLPKDQLGRFQVLNEAYEILIKRLSLAGVL